MRRCVAAFALGHTLRRLFAIPSHVCLFSESNKHRIAEAFAELQMGKQNVSLGEGIGSPKYLALEDVVTIGRPRLRDCCMLAVIGLIEGGWYGAKRAAKLLGMDNLNSCGINLQVEQSDAQWHAFVLRWAEEASATSSAPLFTVPNATVLLPDLFRFFASIPTDDNDKLKTAFYFVFHVIGNTVQCTIDRALGGPVVSLRALVDYAFATEIVQFIGRLRRMDSEGSGSLQLEAAAWTCFAEILLSREQIEKCSAHASRELHKEIPAPLAQLLSRPGVPLLRVAMQCLDKPSLATRHFMLCPVQPQFQHFSLDIGGATIRQWLSIVTQRKIGKKETSEQLGNYDAVPRRRWNNKLVLCGAHAPDEGQSDIFQLSMRDVAASNVMQWFFVDESTGWVQPVWQRLEPNVRRFVFGCSTIAGLVQQSGQLELSLARIMRRLFHPLVARMCVLEPIEEHRAIAVFTAFLAAHEALQAIRECSSELREHKINVVIAIHSIRAATTQLKRFQIRPNLRGVIARLLYVALESYSSLLFTKKCQCASEEAKRQLLSVSLPKHQPSTARRETMAVAAKACVDDAALESHVEKLAASGKWQELLRLLFEQGRLPPLPPSATAAPPFLQEVAKQLALKPPPLAAAPAKWAMLAIKSVTFNHRVNVNEEGILTILNYFQSIVTYTRGYMRGAGREGRSQPHPSLLLGATLVGTWPQTLAISEKAARELALRGRWESVHCLFDFFVAEQLLASRSGEHQDGCKGPDFGALFNELFGSLLRLGVTYGQEKERSLLDGPLLAQFREKQSVFSLEDSIKCFGDFGTNLRLQRSLFFWGKLRSCGARFADSYLRKGLCAIFVAAATDGTRKGVDHSASVQVAGSLITQSIADFGTKRADRNEVDSQAHKDVGSFHVWWRVVVTRDMLSMNHLLMRSALLNFARWCGDERNSSCAGHMDAAICAEFVLLSGNFDAIMAVLRVCPPSALINIAMPFFEKKGWSTHLLLNVIRQATSHPTRGETRKECSIAEKILMQLAGELDGGGVG